MTDLQTKYQKIAAEYSKLKAQIPVLKKAVLDEQNTVEQLNDAIKQRDQIVRKLEQEIDSLTFRNKQLETRVEVLQQCHQQDSKSKKQNKHATLQSDSLRNNVIDEELQNKIHENAQLHQEVSAKDEQYKQLVEDLQSRLDLLERESSQHQLVLNASKQENKELVEKLLAQKSVIESRLQKEERTTKEAVERATFIEESWKAQEKQFTDQLNVARRVIKQKLPFVDSSVAEWNALNLHSYDRQKQLQVKELVGSLSSLVGDVLADLAGYFDDYRRRTSVYPLDGDKEPLSDVNHIFCQKLSECSELVRSADLALKPLVTDESLLTLDFTSVLSSFVEFTSRLEKLISGILPYNLQSLDEESSMSSCTSTLEAKNQVLQSALKNLTESFTKLFSFVSLAVGGSLRCDYSEQSSHLSNLHSLNGALTDLSSAIRELSKHFATKVGLEHQLPTITERLKQANETIARSLGSLVSSSTKLSTFFAYNLNLLCSLWSTGREQEGDVGSSDCLSSLSSASCKVTFATPNVVSLRQKTVNFQSMLLRSQCESIPYSTAIHNQRMLLSSTENSDSLAQQVVALREHLSQLEQENGRWLLECQLLQMKYDKQLKVTSGGGGKECELAEVGESREVFIKQHYNSRLNDIVAQLQLADSKALNFLAECHALQKRLKVSDSERDKLREELSQSIQDIGQLKDEFQTTTKSYEGQLSMMSEHLASMNEKLTTQKDEIDILKYELLNHNKVNKKSTFHRKKDTS